MVTDINIQNFKSIIDLHFSLGRFNVLIGENGCGKSNILEAITFASAASADQLDVSDLEKRGMRVPSPKFMYSAFEGEKKDQIIVDFKQSNGNSEKFCLHFTNEQESGKWIEYGKINGEFLIKSLRDAEIRTLKDVTTVLSNIKLKEFNNIHIRINQEPGRITFGPASFDKSITDFKIYSPNEKALRRFDNPDNRSLGVDGTGLFSYLKNMSSTEKGMKTIQSIILNMNILDWFDDLKIAPDNLSSDNTVMLYDQYIDATLKYFDQRSVNEAFLFLLFYFTLFISDNSPSFFAIDNIESSLNPKLCRRFVQILTKLSEKYDKQVIITTHNPFVLDGLNLADENQRLFVTRRNVDGHTLINRVNIYEKIDIPLSEAWMKGYIGGLPNNF